MIPLIGYSDRLSGRPGDSIAFKVSSIAHEPFTAALLRSISADPNPMGPGIIERPVASSLDGNSYPSRRQPFFAGSYAIADNDIASADNGFRLSALIWPTLPLKGAQAILSCGDISLMIDESGALAGQAGEADHWRHGERYRPPARRCPACYRGAFQWQDRGTRDP